MSWRCERCGAEYEDDDPPCEECGHGWFEEVSEPVAARAREVWECTECGRTHARNSPPCARCGNHDFQRRRQEFDLSDTMAPSYLDLVSPRYLMLVLMALSLLVVLASMQFGLLSTPPFLTDRPSVENAPGNATTAYGISLSDAEAAFLERINERRQASGFTNLSRDGRLDDMARYFTQQRVVADYEGGDLPKSNGLAKRFGYTCQQRMKWQLFPRPDGEGTSIRAVDSGTALGTMLANRTLGSRLVADGDSREIGVDVHVAPDGTVYATAFVC